MKITDPEIIKSGEKDLIDAVREDLDLEAVREILRHRMETAAMTSKGGQIVVHENQIAFRLDFDLKLSGSLLFDREGNYIPDRQDEARAPKASPQPAMADDPGGDLILETAATQTAGAGRPPGGLSGEEDDLSPVVSDLEIDDEDLVDGDPEDAPLPDLDLDTGLVLADEEEPSPADTASRAPAALLLEDDDFSETGSDTAAPPADLADPIPDELALKSDDDDFLGEDSLDDDINDILKESREFWEQKKES